uniref:Uncharacterized protein n=1 Tax=Plectus sambesii TaxID=2011161 RepID=A0A914UYD4_9BILA
MVPRIVSTLEAMLPDLLDLEYNLQEWEEWMINVVYSTCMQCSEFTSKVCAQCAQPLHAYCAPMSGDSIYFCDECGTEMVENARANAELWQGGEYDALEAELS